MMNLDREFRGEKKIVLLYYLRRDAQQATEYNITVQKGEACIISYVVALCDKYPVNAIRSD